MPSSYWNKNNILLLINCYQNEQLLQDLKHERYKNRDSRERAIERIKHELEIDDPTHTFSSEDIKKKIHTLRTQYRSELKLYNSSKSGSAAEDIYIPKLWCFNDLQFLNDGVSLRPSTSSLNVQNTVRIKIFYSFIIQAGNNYLLYVFQVQQSIGKDPLNDHIQVITQNFPESNAEELLSDRQQIHYVTTHTLDVDSDIDEFPAINPTTDVQNSVNRKTNHHSRRKGSSNKQNNSEKEADTLIDTATSALLKCAAEANDCSHFGAYIAKDLSEVNEEQKKFAKRLIAEILYKASQNELSKHSIILEMQPQNQNSHFVLGIVSFDRYAKFFLMILCLCCLFI